jgi:hypothetical protein
MTNQEKFNNWLDLATKDLKAADLLYNGDL